MASIRHLWQSSLAALILTAPAMSLGAQSLTLQGAISRAINEGTTGRNATLSHAATRYRHQSFEASLLPQLSLSATLPSYTSSIISVPQPDGSIQFRGVNQTSADLSLALRQSIPLTGGTLQVQSLLSRFARSGAPDEQWTSTPFRVSLTQPLFSPNNIAWQQEREAITIEQSDKTLLAAREQIAVTVTNLFFEAYIARLSLANARATVAVNDTLLEMNRQREALGRIGAIDLLSAEYRASTARQAVSTAEITVERAEAALRLALNLPGDESLDLSIPQGIPQFQADTALAVSEALHNLPLIDQLELNRLTTRQAVNAAKLSNRFNATINAAWGYNADGAGFKSAYQQLLPAKGFSLSVTMPLLGFGRGSNDIKAAELDRTIAEQNAELTMEQIRSDARFAALDLGQRRRLVAAAAQSDSLAQRQFRLEYDRYVAGRSPSPEAMYNMQDAMNSAYNGYLNALRAYWVSYYTLRQLTLYDFENGRRLQ